MRRINLGWARVLLGGLVVVFGGCGDPERDPEPSLGTSEHELGLGSNPDVPSILRDVAIAAGGNRVAPAIPAINTSNDGRVTLEFGGKGAAKARFGLLVPEKLTASNFIDAPPGMPINGGMLFYQGAIHDTPTTMPTELGFRTVCDAKGSAYTCGVGNADDCYDLTIISPVISNPANRSNLPKRSLRLWGAPVTVRVSAPKTARAALAEVKERGPLVAGPEHVGASTFFEPAVTADGHLLVGRISGSMLDRELRQEGTNLWPATDEAINIVYAMHGDGVAPCDVSRWNLTAITRAPIDPLVNQRYGFARHPFRDTEGRPMVPGTELGGTYPWIDREGRNLFFKSTGRFLYYKDSITNTNVSAYPARCVAGVTCDPSCVAGVPCAPSADYGMLHQQGADTRGASVMGLWTQGRQVMMDGRTNNVDFGLGIDDTRQRELKLYGPANSAKGWIRVGTGRQEGNDSSGAPPVPPEPPSFGNASVISSLENLFNHQPQLHPKTVRDVVWTMNTQNTSEEIVFDDWIDPHALIVSDMMPSWSYHDPDTDKEEYRDGFVEGAGYGGEVRLQNAATALPTAMVVPSYGAVEGPGRTEPVALGGIFGRGFWMTGQNRIVYDISTQPNDFVGNWFTSVFVDAREYSTNETIERRLFTFPDGSFIAVQGHGTVQLYNTAGALIRSVALPAGLGIAGGYRHFGFRRVGASLDVFVDGFLLESVPLSAPLPFGFPPGKFTVGKIATDARPGIRGWFDEVRVFNEFVSLELACNHARGTLVGLGTGAPTAFTDLAALYPATSHARVSGNLPAAKRSPRYVCHHDYSADYKVSTVGLPSGVVSLREALLFPSGPLHFGQPRPDTSQNSFCLTCHVDAVGRAPSLSIAALTLNPSVKMEDDPRRQPLQPSARLFGQIPAGFIGGIQPPTARVAPLDGAKLDQWTSP